MKILAAVTSAFTLIYVFLSNKPSIAIKLSNAFFIIGLVYFCIALVFYVRNVGFFKLLSYRKYSRKQKHLIKAGIIDKDSKKMDLHEFSSKRYEKKWESYLFYKFSIPLLAASLILALM